MKDTNKNLTTKVLGSLGEIIILACFIPQVIKVYVTKDVGSFSSVYLFWSMVGLGIRLFYGFRLRSKPIVLACICQLFIIGYLNYIKFFYR
jgi:uncharacterized protein with PQ loop repeat